MDMTSIDFARSFVAKQQPVVQAELRFDGATYEPERDQARLSRQCKLVLDLMADGAWRTLREIAQATGCPEASVSAWLRDLRKRRFGGYRIEREYVKDGLHRYRLVQP